MRVILVPVADRPECVVALDAAFALAQAMGADVVGAHIRPERRARARLPGAILPLTIADDGDWPALSEKEATRLSQSARALFAKMAKAHGYELAKKPAKDLSPVALWQERVGTPENVMPIIGPLADMVVVSRPIEKAGGGRRARLFLTQALLHAQRPVLVLPQKKTTSLGGHVAIAWNKSGEAARAVHAALPILKVARAVTFLSIGREARPGPSAREMAHYLRHHGIAAGHLSLPDGAAGPDLVRLYRDAGANLLVMGAYSRPRLAELIFGGATRHMLTRANIPVLMLHS
ncbi:MAG: universal stress protein [Pseudomonadota bacterium]